MYPLPGNEAKANGPTWGQRWELSSKVPTWYRGYVKFLGGGVASKPNHSFWKVREREGGESGRFTFKQKADITISAGEFSSWTKQLFIIEQLNLHTLLFIVFKGPGVTVFFVFALFAHQIPDTVSQEGLYSRCFSSFLPAGDVWTTHLIPMIYLYHETWQNGLNWFTYFSATWEKKQQKHLRNLPSGKLTIAMDPRNLQRSDPLNWTPNRPEYLIARSQFTARGPLGFGPIQFLMEWNILIFQEIHRLLPGPFFQSTWGTKGTTLAPASCKDST